MKQDLILRWPALEGKGGLLVSWLLRRAGLTPSPALFIPCFLLDQPGRLRPAAALNCESGLIAFDHVSMAFVLGANLCSTMNY